MKVALAHMFFQIGLPSETKVAASANERRLRHWSIVGASLMFEQLGQENERCITERCICETYRRRSREVHTALDPMGVQSVAREFYFVDNS